MFPGRGFAWKLSPPPAVTKAALVASLPLPPTHLKLHMFPVDLFSFRAAAADHFSLILPVTTGWVAGPGHPRHMLLPGYNPGSCPASPRDGPSRSPGREPGEGMREDWAVYEECF